MSKSGKVKKYRITKSGRKQITTSIKKSMLLKYFKVEETEILSDEVFLEKLKSLYSSLVKSSLMAPYVKVSELRLKALEELGMSREEFDRRIIALNSSNPYAVQLHAGGGEHIEGIKTSRGVYHYAIIK
ncbi:MAG: hypothetical protein ACUVQ0_01490 [Thermoproteota archaeon]